MNTGKESFVRNVFMKTHYPKLGVRKKTFKAIFELLEAKGKNDYLIVETGCARPSGSWDGDEQSTLMFDQFVKYSGRE